MGDSMPCLHPSRRPPGSDAMLGTSSVYHICPLQASTPDDLRTAYEPPKMAPEPPVALVGEAAAS